MAQSIAPEAAAAGSTVLKPGPQDNTSMSDVYFSPEKKTLTTVKKLPSTKPPALRPPKPPKGWRTGRVTTGITSVLSKTGLSRKGKNAK